jgi:hypothetical protein
MATPAKRLFRPLRSAARPWRPAASPTYRPRRPTTTPLYPVVQHHLETFLARTAEADPLGNGVPWWVEKDFRAYLRCGILAHGFARARCLAWFHGEKGKQKAPAIEYVLLGLIGVAWIVVNVLAVVC